MKALATTGQVLAGLFAGLGTGWLALIAFAEAIDMAAGWIPVVAIAGGLLLARRSARWRAFGQAFAVGSGLAMAALVALFFWLPGG